MPLVFKKGIIWNFPSMNQEHNINKITDLIAFLESVKGVKVKYHTINVKR